MRKSILFLFASLLSIIVQAQLSETDKVKTSLGVENRDTVAWIRNGVAQLGLNQGFLHNWSAGGEVASLAIDGLLSGNITRLYHNNVWSNSVDASYSLFYAIPITSYRAK